MKGSYYIIQASLIEISTYNYQVYLYTYIGIYDETYITVT